MLLERLEDERRFRRDRRRTFKRPQRRARSCSAGWRYPPLPADVRRRDLSSMAPASRRASPAAGRRSQPRRGRARAIIRCGASGVRAILRRGPKAVRPPVRYRGPAPSLTATTRIRPMLAADILAATRVILDGGWGDRSPFFRWAVDHPTVHPLVADEDGRVVGTGVATANAALGWVGAIFVDVERRRAALGPRSRRPSWRNSSGAGCTTQLLIATDEGRPIYERLGSSSRRATCAPWRRRAAAQGPRDGQAAGAGRPRRHQRP